MAGTRSLDAARWFISVAADSDRTLTNFQVQKLLFYAHGDFLRRHGKPLITEGFQAWDHGPVCPPAYKAFSSFRAEPIVGIEQDRPRWASQLGPDALVALEQTWADYADWTVSDLWDDTHRPGSPWAEVYVEGVDGIVIPDPMILAYFSDIQRPRLRRSMNRLRKRRDARGDTRGEVIGDSGLVSEIELWGDLRANGTRGLLG